MASLIDKLVNIISNKNKNYMTLEEVEKIILNNLNVSKNEVIQVLKDLRFSKYCLPLVDTKIKISFVSTPNWANNFKKYRINGLDYSHIEIY